MGFDLKRAAAASADGKALAYHPALADRTPVSAYTPGSRNPRDDAVISHRTAALHGDAYGGKQAIDWVYDAIGLYIDPIVTAPYRLERTDGTKLVRTRTKGTPPDHEVGPKEIYDLFDKPNPFQLYEEVMALLVIDLLLVGNAYWFKWQVNSEGRPLALYRLAPSHVKIKPGPYGPKEYEYQPPGARNPLRIKPQDIIHFRRPNPHDQYYGMGIIQGGGRAMDLELALTDTMAAYYENKADPSLIVQSERRLPRDVFNKLRAQVRARASGSHNAGELLVLEAGLKASTLSASARDALFEELASMSRNRIFVKFRTSPLLYGLLDQASGSNRVSDARREFDNATLQPFMAKISRAISAGLLEQLGLRYYIDHEEILPPEEAIKVGESLAKMPGIKVRELRRAYRQFGLEESTGDLVIDEMVLNLPGEELDENGQGGFADRPLGSEPGRPPLGENTRAFSADSPSVENARVRSPEQKALDAVARLQAQIEAKAIVENTAGERVTVGNRLQGEERPDDTFAAARTADINAAQNYMVAELRDAVTELERGLLDTVEGKALKTSNIVSRIRSSAAWKTFRERVQAILEEGTRRAAASGVMQSGLTPDEDVDYDEIAATIIHRPDGLKSIIATIKDRVAKQVKETRDADGERSDFEAAVRSSLADYADRHIVAIADSEATEAYNEGTLTAAELSGVTEVFVVEEEDAPDKPCQDARGEVWDIAKARANRKEHPRCRRAFLPLSPSTVS